MKNNKIYLALFSFLLIFSLVFIVIFGKNEENGEEKLISANLPNESETILYYGNTCPHCEDVEKWIVDNKAEEKVKITHKEVYENEENSTELTAVAENCGITDGVGVPFLYGEGECFMGIPDIVSYLENKIKE